MQQSETRVTVLQTCTQATLCLQTTCFDNLKGIKLPEYDIAIVGSVCSGKTALIQCLQGKSFSSRGYFPTLHKQEYEIRLGSQTLWALDCPATERPNSEDKIRLPIVCFNLASQFDQLRVFELLKYYQQQDILVVAMKVDEAIYSEKEFYQFCQSYAVPIENTLMFSAKTGLNGELLKKTLLEKVRQKQKPIDVIKHELNRNHLFYKKLLIIENQVEQTFYQFDTYARLSHHDLIKNALAYYLSQFHPLYQQRSDSEHTRLREQFLAFYDYLWAKYNPMQPAKWYTEALQVIEFKNWTIPALISVFTGIIVAYMVVSIMLIFNPLSSLLWLPLVVAPFASTLTAVCGLTARELRHAKKACNNPDQLKQNHLKEDLIEILEYTANREERDALFSVNPL
ncbi:GTPase domain-containing protein [Legionella dresdenensis]|uniref:GTPase domain-containing protein n=1 Tax=Legionella dresdenensis TaxID=450200 RepID=A0ABV8CEV3_9GAMM